MSINTYQNSGVKGLAGVLRLLGEPNRLKIMRGLRLECRSVNQIVKAAALSQSNVSFHLRLLREAGLVRPERRGKFIFYCLPDPRLARILDALDAWASASDGKVGGAKKRGGAVKPSAPRKPR